MNGVGIISEPKLEVIRLQSVIADALQAMDEGRYGDCRRILKTGRASPVRAVTGVLAKGQV